MRNKIKKIVNKIVEIEDIKCIELDEDSFTIAIYSDSFSEETICEIKDRLREVFQPKEITFYLNIIVYTLHLKIQYYLSLNFIITNTKKSC